MSFTFNLKSIATVAFASALLFSCSSDSSEDVLGTNPEEEGGLTTTETATIRVTEGGATDDKFEAMVTGEAGMTAQARVILKGTDKTQRRLYVTKQELGGLAEPFIIPELNNKQTKADGSIDLTSESKNELDFTFDLDVPTGMTNGSIIYKFWTTSGRGDFREQSKRLVAGVGTVTVSIGNGRNPDALVREFKDVKLFAPDSEGNSATFFSLLDGEEYLINQGIEYAAFWDFGYYHLNGTGANLSSTNSYRTDVVDVPLKSGTPKEELNITYFKLGTIGSYNGATMSKDFDALTVSNSSPELISELKVNDEVEFIDQYGKKGLIKIKEIEPGFSPTQDFIIIDVKVQP